MRAASSAHDPRLSSREGGAAQVERCLSPSVATGCLAFAGYDKRAFEGGPLLRREDHFERPLPFFCSSHVAIERAATCTAYPIVPPRELRGKEPVKCYLPFIPRLRKGATLLIA